MKKELLYFFVAMIFMSCNKEEDQTVSEPNTVYVYGVTASPTASESVTIKNNSGSSQDLSGWTIGDENNSSAYNIPSGNNLSQGSTSTFSASTMGFQINDSGETIYLKNASGTLIDTWTN